MAHKVYTIDKFEGMVTNVPSRLSKRPIKLTADFDRVGGYSQLPSYKEIPTHAQLIAYDESGVYAYKTDDGSYHVGDAETGVEGSYQFDVQPASVHYVPGGGLFFTDYNSTSNTYSISGALLVSEDSSSVTYQSLPAQTDDNITIKKTSGTFYYIEVAVDLVAFYPTKLGYIPFGTWSRKDAFMSSSNAEDTGAYVTRLNITYDKALTHIYLHISTADVGLMSFNGVETYRAYVGPADEAPHMIQIQSLTNFSDNARPVFYSHRVEYNGVMYQKHEKDAALSGSRVFYVNPHLYEIRSPGNLESNIYPHANRIYYTDAGYLSFSDDTASPLQIAFDNHIQSVTQSPRGIYVFSDKNVWEAYGDFVTANTRVSKIPVLGGVDTNTGNNVTSGGGSTYFIKEGIIHSLSPSGVKQIGRAIFKENEQIHSIYFDQYRRRLLAVNHNGQIVYEYDPQVDGWLQWPEAGIPPYRSQPFILNVAKNKYFADGRYITLL